MIMLKSVFLFALLQCALSQDGGLLNPCKVRDIKCLSETTQNFLEKTSAGIPEFYIKPIDPLVIPELNYEVPESDLVFHFKNINITGLKNQQISDFQMDQASKSVVLQTKIDGANIVADFAIEMKGSEKLLSGTYFAKTNAKVTSRYTYELVPNKQGIEYFDVGPATITCHTLGEPEVTLSPELANAIASDSSAQSMKEDYYKRATELRQALMSKILSEAYVTVIHNLRASAKIFPKTAFFKDI